jgi:hypothetical protein
MTAKNLSFILTLIFLTCQANLFAQEIVNGLSVHPAYQFQTQKSSKNKTAEEIVLNLPFFEDFSKSKVNTNNLIWPENAVFINADFPFLPPNRQAATFDVLDSQGKVYENASTRPFIADVLESALIRLDSVFSPELKNLTPADSVYFSFYYQPQGRGDKPEEHDSLVLQFGYPSGEMEFDFMDSTTVWVDDYLLANNIDSIFPLDTLFAPLGCDTNLFWISNRILTWGDQITIPCDSVFKPAVNWETVWATPGMSLDSFYFFNGNYFKQILIPVLDTSYFSNRFQFRFYNYGSISDNTLPANRSNVDQWNLDMIRLDYNRNFADSTYPLLSFSERAPSFLRRYQAMPYKQYRSDPTNAVKPTFEMFITNQDSITHNTTYSYRVKQNFGNQLFSYNGGNCNLDPFITTGFQTCQTGCGAAHACPPVQSLFSLDFDRDSTSYLITHYISDSTLQPPLVDSITYHQGFYNYFAYDDGTPELGYGLEPAGAHMAVQYRMVVPDTLKGIQMLFNRTLNNTNNKFFDIVVWKDNNGMPGEEVYRLVRQRPQWSDNLYEFYFYEFPDPIIMNGIFYVGLMQEEMGSINIGFDAALDNSQYNFYRSDNQWRKSLVPGSIMLRPVVGSSYFVDVPKFTSSKAHELRCYPNPAQNSVNLSINGFIPEDQTKIQFFDLTARLIHEQNWQDQVSLSQFSKGIYFVRITHQNRHIAMQKLVITP